MENDPPSPVQPQPPPNAVETRRDVEVDNGEEGVFNNMAAFAPGKGGDTEKPSLGTGQDSSVSRRIDVDISGEEGGLNSTAAFAPERGGDAQDPSPGTGQDSLVLRQMSMLAIVAGLVAVVFDYEHSMAGFYWFRNWVRCFRMPGFVLADSVVSEIG